jgi:hypothetical protein
MNYMENQHWKHLAICRLRRKLIANAMESDVTVPLRNEVVMQLPWLFDELGFRILEEGHDRESFGNSFVTLGSPSVYLRFIRDRGQIFGEIASHTEPNAWWDLHWISELIPGSSYPLPELIPVATLIRSNFSLLSEYFGSKYHETKRELWRREEQRKKEGLRRFGR